MIFLSFKINPEIGKRGKITSCILLKSSQESHKIIYNLPKQKILPEPEEGSQEWTNTRLRHEDLGKEEN